MTPSQEIAHWRKKCEALEVIVERLQEKIKVLHPPDDADEVAKLRDFLSPVVLSGVLNPVTRLLFTIAVSNRSFYSHQAVLAFVVKEQRDEYRDERRCANVYVSHMRGAVEKCISWGAISAAPFRRAAFFPTIRNEGYQVPPHTRTIAAAIVRAAGCEVPSS